MLIPEDSPLRKPPSDLSRRQILILDGIRYAAEIADIAYQRLVENLQSIAKSSSRPSTREIAIAIADAWTIVDSVHRFHDLITNMPGLRNASWRRLLYNQTRDCIELRDCVQHQLGELDNLIIHAGQIWGYLSWAEVVERRYTGKWLMLSPGADYVGDQWFFIGPNKLPFQAPLGRVRLNAFGRQVYLGRAVHAVHNAVAALSVELANGNVRPTDTPASDRRGADLMFEGMLMIEVAPRATKEYSPLDDSQTKKSKLSK